MSVECGSHGVTVCGQDMMDKRHMEIAHVLSAALHQAAAGATSARLFALVDGALLREFPKRVQQLWRAENALSLLTGATGMGAAAVGPLLFELSPDQMAAGRPATLLDMKTGRSAGSFLASGQRLNELAAVLAQYVDVKLDDGSTMVMRFFDPRVLPFWLNILQPDHSAHLASAVSRWLYWDAQLALRAVDLNSRNASEAAATFPVQLSSGAEQKLLDNCYPFTVIERFRVEDAAALAQVPLKDRYDFFRDQLSRAAGHGIQGAGEVEAYCGLAIEFGPHFDEDQAIRSTLLKVKAGEKLLEALAEVEDADWARLKGQT